jgi:hypothetical protein
MVKTAYGVTRPPDHPAIVYLTCVTIPDPLYQVSYSYHDPYRCPSCRTYHLHTTRQANTILQTRNKDKGKINETAPDSNSNLTMSMTHHNQTKELPTWFLT